MNTGLNGKVDYDAMLNGNFHQPGDLLPDRPKPETGMPPLPEKAHIDPAVADNASPWLDEYIQFSRIWSPRAHDDFHESVGLWLLSTIAARRVALDLGKRRYTGLYIALTARTSVFAKSTTAEVAQALLKEIGLSYLLAPDDATPQAFIRMMTYKLSDDWPTLSPELKEAQKQRIAFAAQKGWFFDEFGQKVTSMMREGGFMADFRGLIRCFDDTPPVYEYDSISRGRETVYSPYLALLANLTPADLKPFAKRGSALWNDGFWARFAFLTPPAYAERRNGRFPDHQRAIPDSLVKPLRTWHRWLGIPHVDINERETDNGKTKLDLLVTPPEPKMCILGDGVYDAYYTYNDALIDLVTESNLTDLDGNYSRLPEKALRVAMLLASLENDNTIHIRHWARAQRIAEDWRRNLHNLYEQVITPAEDMKAIAVEDRIMKYIAEKGPRTIRELCQGIWGLDTGTAKIVTKSLADAGFLQARKNGRAECFALAIPIESVDVDV